MSVLTPEQQDAIVRYEERRVNVHRRFKNMPYGSQQRASFDLREAPTTVSNVLNGRIRSETVLAKLEGWLDGTTGSDPD